MPDSFSPRFSAARFSPTRAGLLSAVLMLLAAAAPAAEPTLEFIGVSEELRDNLRAGLSLSAEPCDAPAWRVKRLFRGSEKELSNAARALGYYAIQTKKSLSFKDACWQASFNIIAGEPIKLSEVEITFIGEANNDAAFLELVQKSPLQRGKPVHHGQYEQLKSQIEGLAAEHGYFDGHFLRKELKVDPAANRASVLLEYDAGQRYHIGTLHLDQDTYDPELLERYLTIHAGDAYDASALADLHRTLGDSGYFDSVEVQPDFSTAEDGNINVHVALTPRKKMAYSVGLGAATDTGPRVSLSYERRRLNRYGHRLEASVILSTVDASLGLEYLIPMNLPHVEQLSLRSGYRQLDTSTSTSNSVTFGARAIGRRWGWNEIRYLDWINEDSTIGEETTSATLLVPGISWTRSRADNRMRATRGQRINLELRGAHSSLLSDTTFSQIIASGKWIYPLGAGRILLRGESGISVVSDFNELPASYRFFAGGDQSVRGYGYQALGPRDDNNDVIGGRYLLASSVELEYPVYKEWSAAVFVDAGNAFDDFNVGLKHSYGFGVRWQSPVGPIRLDLALPSDTSEDSFRIHFSMGPDL